MALACVFCSKSVPCHKLVDHLASHGAHTQRATGRSFKAVVLVEGKVDYAASQFVVLCFNDGVRVLWGIRCERVRGLARVSCGILSLFRAASSQQQQQHQDLSGVEPAPFWPCVSSGVCCTTTTSKRDGTSTRVVTVAANNNTATQDDRDRSSSSGSASSLGGGCGSHGGGGGSSVVGSGGSTCSSEDGGDDEYQHHNHHRKHRKHRNRYNDDDDDGNESVLSFTVDTPSLVGTPMWTEHEHLHGKGQCFSSSSKTSCSWGLLGSNSSSSSSGGLGGGGNVTATDDKPLCRTEITITSTQTGSTLVWQGAPRRRNAGQFFEALITGSDMHHEQPIGIDEVASYKISIDCAALR